jgi:type IV pilus assembly protein PilA
MKSRLIILKNLCVLLVMGGLLQSCSDREELAKQVKAQQEEIAQLKAENERLKSDRSQNGQENPQETFLSQTAKGKQAEAKQNVSAVNRSQTAYSAEKSSFADSFDKLALGTLNGGLTDETTNYIYQITPGTNTASITATSKDSTLKSYAGASTRYVNAQSQSVISSVLCESNEPGTPPPQFTKLGGKEPECPLGSTELQ